MGLCLGIHIPFSLSERHFRSKTDPVHNKQIQIMCLFLKISNGYFLILGFDLNLTLIKACREVYHFNLLPLGGIVVVLSLERTAFVWRRSIVCICTYIYFFHKTILQIHQIHVLCILYEFALHLILLTYHNLCINCYNGICLQYLKTLITYCVFVCFVSWILRLK